MGTPDEVTRCGWVRLSHPASVRYHDEEWGVPVHDDRRLFELLLLEGFQAGLSWACILDKREAFSRAFDGFDPERVSAYGAEKLAALERNPGIVRNRLKIRAAVNNAEIFRRIQEEWESFHRYLWYWTGGRVIYETGQVRSGLSDAVSGDLRKRGMKFNGNRHRVRLSADGGGDQFPCGDLLLQNTQAAPSL